MSEYAPGIPSKTTMRGIPSISSPILTDFVLHEHHAERAGKHFDFRINLNNVAYSWAMKYFPETPGEKRLAVRQPDHTVQYMKFTGVIEDGYGKGRVFIKNSGKVKLLYSKPQAIKFVFISERDTREFLLRKTSDKNWLMMNLTRVRKESDPIGKDKYKDYTGKDINKFLEDDQYVLQPKIDGAHAVLLLEKGKYPRIISYRKSKRNATGLIDHTHKFPGLPHKKVPAGLAGTYRGEIYLAKKGVPIAPAKIGGVLNSKTDKSLETQKSQRLKIKLALFGVDEDKRRKLIEFLGDHLEGIETARGTSAKKKLLEKIKNKTHGLTEEGVVIVDKDTGKPFKFKLRPDFDVHIRHILPGGGKYTGRAAAGFAYSLTPKGDIVGKVGTGFTDKIRIDMWENPEKYVGKVAIIFAMRQEPSGAYFQPSFYRLHLDK